MCYTYIKNNVNRRVFFICIYLPNRQIQRRVERHIAPVRSAPFGHPILIFKHAERLECVHRHGHLGHLDQLVLLDGLLGRSCRGSQQLLGLHLILIVALFLLHLKRWSLHGHLLGQLVVGLK